MWVLYPTGGKHFNLSSKQWSTCLQRKRTGGVEKSFYFIKVWATEKKKLFPEVWALARSEREKKRQWLNSQQKAFIELNDLSTPSDKRKKIEYSISRFSLDIFCCPSLRFSERPISFYFLLFSVELKYHAPFRVSLHSFSKLNVTLIFPSLRLWQNDHQFQFASRICDNKH